MPDGVWVGSQVTGDQVGARAVASPDELFGGLEDQASAQRQLHDLLALTPEAEREHVLAAKQQVERRMRALMAGAGGKRASA